MPEQKASERVLQELERISTFFPILTAVGTRLAASRPWEGKVMAAHLHLTTLTAALVRELSLGGGSWVISAANPATTDPAVVSYLKNMGMTVYSGRSVEDGILETLKAEPVWFADVGFALGSSAIKQGVALKGGVEISRSGITKLRSLELPFPVVNIDGGRLKPAVENRHGVGEGLWQTFTALTGKHLAGRRVVVVGYGPVGSGVAAYARAGGAHVSVVDTSPIRRLIAQYDGFDTPELDQVCGSVQVLVTATGSRNVIRLEHIQKLPSGAILINVGHHNDEIQVERLKKEAEAVDQIGPQVVRYRLQGRWRVVLAEGNPLNIVMNAGSQEPVLLHFTVLALSLAWLARAELAPGEHVVPVEIEEEAARLALQARI
jgi:adenosylhomocysteinase